MRVQVYKEVHMTQKMLEADGLEKRFGRVKALDGLTLSAPSGGVLAVLGPNGAGKSTFVRMVATLTAPDAGSLEVAGIDALRHPARVRRVIGLAGQSAAVEEAMTGRENLEMVARLFGWSRTRCSTPSDRRARATRPRRRRRPARARLVRWHAAPARPRGHARRRAPPAAARRADDGARPGQPGRPVGGRA